MVLTHVIADEGGYKALVGKSEKIFSCKYGCKKIISTPEFPLKLQYDLETHYLSVEGGFSTQTILKKWKLNIPLLVPANSTKELYVKHDTKLVFENLRQYESIVHFN